MFMIPMPPMSRLIAAIEIGGLLPPADLLAACIQRKSEVYLPEAKSLAGVAEHVTTNTPRSRQHEAHSSALVGGELCGREHHRLDQELQGHVPAPCAERAADPDLARPLGHGREHDVHDPDAADEQ